MSMTKAHPTRPAANGDASSTARKSKARKTAATAATDFWNAVVARDRAFDGTFYYAVATTSSRR